MASSVVISLNRDFVVGDNISISVEDGGVQTTYQWDFVALRSAVFEITEGTPTGTAGETSATNFKAAIDLDLPTYTSSVTSNEITITAPNETLIFIGVKAGTGGTGFPSYIDVTFDNVEAPVDISNVNFILADSPHYINTPFSFTTTTSTTIQVYVWNGDLASVPAQPTYTITKPRPSVNFAEFNTDISELVSDNLIPVPNIVLTATTQITDAGNNDVKWVKWIATYNDPQETIAPTEDTLLALFGYGLYPEGVNPTKPSNNILTSSFLRKASRDGFILLPFVNNGEITSIDIDSDKGNINANEVITDVDNSNKAVQYLSVDLSAATTDDFVTVTFNPSGVEVIYQIEDECRYEPKQVVFLNRYGVYDTMTLFKKSNETLSVTNDDFVNAYISNGSYSTSLHQKQKINIQGSKKITVNSGYIPEQENKLYEEALMSNKVYFYEDGALIPVNISSSSLEFKTRVNDRLVNYTIEFEYAYNQKQNV